MREENAEMLITAAAAVSAQLVVQTGERALRGNETIKLTMKAWEVPKEGSLF